MDVRKTANPDRLAVQRGAILSLGGEKLIVHRIVDKTDLDLPVPDKRDRDAKLRDATHEVSGPIDRVDHPDAVAKGASALFAKERILRKALKEAVADEAFDFRVDCGKV